MTKEQKNKVIAVIRQDADGRFHYCLGDRYCVIGGLLKAAGWTDDQLEELGVLAITSPTHLMAARKTLREVYGLESGIALQLQMINDEHGDIRKRRKELINYVKTSLAIEALEDMDT